MKHLFIIFVCLYSFVFSSENIGTVTAFSGKATVQRDDKIVDMYLGFYLFKNDTIKTSNNSRIQLVFKDKTIISLGENSEFNIEDYFYDEQNQKQQKASFKFLNGVFKSITGKIGKVNPNKFKLKTKSASIGIRGTTFFGTVDNINGEDIACTQGKITVDTGKGKIAVPAGRYTAVEQNKTPTKPIIITAKKLLQLEKTSGALDNERESGIRQKIPTVLEQKKPIVKKEPSFIIINSINVFTVYDDNINKNFNPNVILDDNSKRKKDLYIGLKMKNEILVPYKKNEKFNTIHSLTTTVKDYSKYNDNDLLHLQLNSGLEYNTSNSKNTATIEFEKLWLNMEQSMFIYGILNNFEYNLNNNYKVFSNFVFKKKKLSQNQNNDADTKIRKANFALEIPLKNINERLNLSTGIEDYRKENTSYININRDIYEIQALYTIALTNNYLLDSSITYKQIKYLDKYQDSSKRKDIQHSFFLNITKIIDKKSKVFVSYEHSNSNSNIKTLSYDKNTLGIYFKILF